MSKESILKEVGKGCGKEYLSKDGEFEMMCGKHIWETPSEIAELRLCEWCQHLYDFIKDDKCVNQDALVSGVEE